MNGWSLTYEGFLPTEEGLREALCTLGNGVFATRGAAPEAVADEVHYPGTYAAGVYDRLRTEIAGRTVENEDLVNAPNWLVLTFRPAGGDWLDLGSVEVLSYLPVTRYHSSRSSNLLHSILAISKRRNARYRPQRTTVP